MDSLFCGGTVLCDGATYDLTVSRLLLAAGLSALLFAGSYGAYSKILHPFAEIPGPFLAAISPVWMMRAVYGKKLNRDIKKLHDQYGDVVRVGPNTLSFATVEAQKTVHNGKTDDGKYFTKFGTIEWLLGVMVWPAPNLLTTTDADAHQRLRKAVQPAFTAREHRKQGPILHKWTDGWIHGLEALCARGEEVDMTESISQLVWNQLGDLAFGEPLPRSQLQKFNLLKKLACKMSPLLEFMQFMISLPIIESTVVWFVNSYPRLFRLPRDILPKGTLRRTLERTDRGRDFLSAMQDVEQKGITLSPAQLQSNSAMLVMVGQDATVTCLSSTLYFLLRHPAEGHMARLQAEVRAAVASPDAMTDEVLAGLPILNASLKEAMRMVSPANGTGTHRQSMGAFVGDVWVPAGSTVGVDLYTISRSSKYFAEPDRYAPERWYDKAPGSKFENDVLSASTPFLLGPRVCLGRELAMQIARLVLARLVWLFDAEMLNAQEFDWERDCDSSYLWLGHQVKVRLHARVEE